MQKVTNLDALKLARFIERMTRCADVNSLDKHFQRLLDAANTTDLDERSIDKSPDRQKDLLATISQIYENQKKLILKSSVDSLSGLLNRESFDEILKREMRASLKREEKKRKQDATERKSFLALIDIDKFKEVNDIWGHLYGDEIIVMTAQFMQKCFRENDLLFRYGGEEFAAIIKNVTKQEALSAAERFREEYKSFEFPQVGRKTISIGITEIKGVNLPAEIIERADKALYYSKQNGRDQTSIYENLISETLLKQQRIQEVENAEIF